MSLVPRATRANLRVGVGVLGRQPAAGEHADAAGVAGGGEPTGRHHERLGPAGRAQLAGVLVAHLRVGQPVGLVATSRRRSGPCR